jgi:hypothetical protein
MASRWILLCAFGMQWIRVGGGLSLFMVATTSTAADVVGAHRVLAVHEHPLPKRKLRGESFVCAVCTRLRYAECHACATCSNFFVCVPCFATAWTEQEECYQEALALERAAADAQAAKRTMLGGSHTIGLTSSPSVLVADTAATELPPLLQACVLGDVYTAKDIVDKSDFMQDLDLEATVSHGPHAGRTALILAAQAGHKDIVELLLSRDVQREAVDNLGLTALMHAAHAGHTDVVDELLFNGATVDRVAFCGYTAMLLATNRGHADVVRRLLAAGASPLARTPAGRNAVLVAAFNGHLPTVKVLVDVTGIELDARDDEGYNAVDAACANNHPAVATFLAGVL